MKTTAELLEQAESRECRRKALMLKIGALTISQTLGMRVILRASVGDDHNLCEEQFDNAELILAILRARQ